uniref:Uncharacterized protein n=1 Tax=Oryza brachyantha TaxID=4533 RepID=J3N8H7_ORYBR
MYKHHSFRAIFKENNSISIKISRNELKFERKEFTEVVAEVEGAVGGPCGVVGGRSVRLAIEEPPRALTDGVVGTERRRSRRVPASAGGRRRRVARSRHRRSCAENSSKQHQYYYHGHCYKIAHG